MDIDQTAVLPKAEAGLRHFMHLVYGWMSLGLLVTGACAAYMASDPQMILNLIRNKLLFYGLLIAELGLVLVLAGWVERMEANTAKVAFLSYAALTGVTTSVVFLAYTRDSIASTFFVTSGMFAALCATNEAIMRARTRKELFELVCAAASTGGKFTSTLIGLAEPGALAVD